MFCVLRLHIKTLNGHYYQQYCFRIGTERKNLPMLEQGKISPRQLMGLVLSFTLGSAILIIPTALTASAKQDAWLAMLLATIAGLGIITVYTALALKFPEQTFFQSLSDMPGYS
jgi:VIT1/CCC1 family predicted Fe2+/Mn2+ transporter